MQLITKLFCFQFYLIPYKIQIYDLNKIEKLNKYNLLTKLPQIRK